VCCQGITQTFEKFNVKSFNEDIGGCVSIVFCKYDGGIANSTHMSSKYEILV
jgi:hypothetical protein